VRPWRSGAARPSLAIIDEAGQLQARLRIGDDAAGFAALLEQLATHTGSSAPATSRSRSRPPSGPWLRRAVVSGNRISDTIATKID